MIYVWAACTFAIGTGFFAFAYEVGQRNGRKDARVEYELESVKALDAARQEGYNIAAGQFGRFYEKGFAEGRKPFVHTQRDEHGRFVKESNESA